MYGGNIRRIRKRKKITQEGLANRIGVSRQAVCMWEAGKRELRGTTIRKISQIFSVRPGEILGEAAITGGKKAFKVKKIGKGALTRKENGMRETITLSAKKKCGAGFEIVKSAQSKAAFTLMAPNAAKVAVTGSFNSWNKTGMPLKKEKNGAWTGVLNLKPARYEYKFIVDGQWWTDPANRNTVRNSFGSDNSVIEIKG